AIEVVVDAPGKPTFTWSKRIAAGERIVVEPWPARPEIPTPPPTSSGRLFKILGWSSLCAMIVASAVTYAGARREQNFERAPFVALFRSDGRTCLDSNNEPYSFTSNDCYTAMGKEARGVQQPNNAAYNYACNGHTMVLVGIPLAIGFAAAGAILLGIGY